MRARLNGVALVFAAAAAAAALVFALLTAGSAAIIVSLIAVVLVLWGAFRSMPPNRGHGLLTITTVALAVVVSWPGAPGVVLLLCIPTVLAWLRLRNTSPPWLGAVLAYAVLGATTQAMTTESGLEAVLNAFVRCFLTAGALVAVGAASGPHSSSDLPGGVEGRLSTVLAAGSLVVTAGISIALGLPSRQFSTERLSGYLNADGSSRPTGWAPSPNEMGLILAIAAVGALAVWLTSNGRTAWSAAAASAAAAAGAWATGTRSAVIGIIAGAVAVLALTGRPRKAGRRVVLGSALAIAAVLVLTTSGAGRDLLGRGGDGSAQYRSSVIERVVARIAAGHQGPTGVGFIEGNQVPPNPLFSGIAVVDGSLFYIAASLGLIGLALFAALLVGVLVSALQGRNPASCVLIVFATVMLLDNSVAWPSALISLIAVGGSLAASESPYRQQRALRRGDRIDESSASRSRRRA